MPKSTSIETRALANATRSRMSGTQRPPHRDGFAHALVPDRPIQESLTKRDREDLGIEGRIVRYARRGSGRDHRAERRGQIDAAEDACRASPNRDRRVADRSRARGESSRGGRGFSPELTGRENIYLNGAILGMKKVEIDREFDEIVAFAETEKFLDTPIKRYSSGMRVRLGFAVAAHLNPEILIVDEVLAVGTTRFRRSASANRGDWGRRATGAVIVSTACPPFSDSVPRG